MLKKPLDAGSAWLKLCTCDSKHVRTMDLIHIGNDIKRRREDAVEPDIGGLQKCAELQDG